MKRELQEKCAQWWADRLEIEEKRDAFKQALAPKIHEKMILRVEYDPDDILLEALHEVGIKCRGVLFSAKGIFPAKTTMKIREQVRVKEGYGADFTPLAGQDEPDW